MITRERAWAQLTQWTNSPSLRKHARSVELAMRAAAEAYGNGNADVEAFGIVGALHDADYQRWPDQHPSVIVRWLEERGETAMARAIAGHYTKWGKPCETLMEKCIVATDELTGFIVACALLRPDGIASLMPASVRKKLRDNSFAAKVDRGEIQTGCDLLGVELSHHIQLIIDALKPHAAELGIAARAVRSA